MIPFKDFNQQMQGQFSRMTSGKLYRAKITGDQIWEAYLSGFLPEENPVFRHPDSTYHTCRHDMNFIRAYGNVVSIDSDGKLVSIFDFETGYPYVNALAAVKKLFKNAKIESVFVETFDHLNSMPYEKCAKSAQTFQLGHKQTLRVYKEEETFGIVVAGKVYEFSHFHLNLPRQFVDFSGKSIESIAGERNIDFSVFHRLMEEVSLDTFELVVDYINQGSIMNSTKKLDALAKAIECKKQYDAAQNKLNFCWLASQNNPSARLRNESIGTLLVELSQGANPETACRKYNQMVDPVNYMRATAPISQNQIKNFEKFVAENGYEESFDRELATVGDVNITEILLVSNSDEKPKGFVAGVTANKATQHKKSKLDGVHEVSYQKFMDEILPKATGLELFVEPQNVEQFVALHKPSNPNAPQIFNWSNGIGWTTINNLTGKSEIKEKVKEAGGNVSGVLRFSIVWNRAEDNTLATVDFDLHAVEPDRTHIYYASSYRKDRGDVKTKMGGQLDIDMISPKHVGVENIYWQDINKMRDGVYVCSVKNFSVSPNRGFVLQVEANGKLYNYKYPAQLMGQKDMVEVTLKNGVFTVNKVNDILVEEEIAPTEVWGIQTGKFHKVNLCCFSPNCWGEREAGNKHLFLMLEGCKPDKPLRGLHNEFLKPDFRAHRGVIEQFADKKMIQPVGKNVLAGIGFNTTVNGEFTVKVKGSHERVLKVKI